MRQPKNRPQETAVVSTEMERDLPLMVEAGARDSSLADVAVAGADSLEAEVVASILARITLVSRPKAPRKTSRATDRVFVDGEPRQNRGKTICIYRRLPCFSWWEYW